MTWSRLQLITEDQSALQLVAQATSESFATTAHVIMEGELMVRWMACATISGSSFAWGRNIVRRQSETMQSGGAAGQHRR